MGNNNDPFNIEDNTPKLSINDDLLKEYLENTSRRSLMRDNRPALNPEQVKAYTGGTDFDKLVNTLDQKNVNIFYDDVQQRLGEDQSAWSKWGNFAVQVAAEVVGGTIEGIGYLGDIEGLVKTVDGDMSSFGNWLSDIGVAMKEGSREHFKIFGAHDMGNLGFWLSNGVSVASTLSLMIPAYGAVRGVSALGKAMGLAAKFSDPALKTMTVVGRAFASRHMENMMEARQTWEATRQEAINLGEDLTSANLLASEAASDLYAVNYLLMAQDIFQYKMLARGSKINADITSRRLAKTLGVNANKVTGKAVYDQLKVMGSEGLEEALQYIFAEEAKYSALQNAGLIPEKQREERVDKYLKSGEMWTNAMFGALGAGIMQGGRNITKKYTKAGKAEKAELERRIAHAKNLYADTTAAAVKLQAAMNEKNPKAIEEAENEMIFNIAANSAELGLFDQGMATMDDLIESDQEEAGADPNNFSPEFKEKLKDIKKKMQVIGKLYDKNSRKYNPATVGAITRLQWDNIRNNEKQPGLKTKELEQKAAFPSYDNLSSEGLKLFDLETTKLGLERAIQTQKDLIKTSKKGSFSQLRAIQRAADWTESLKRITKLINTAKQMQNQLISEERTANELNQEEVGEVAARIQKDREILSGLEENTDELSSTISERLYNERMINENNADLKELMSNKGQARQRELQEEFQRKEKERIRKEKEEQKQRDNDNTQTAADNSLNNSKQNVDDDQDEQDNIADDTADQNVDDENIQREAEQDESTSLKNWSDKELNQRLKEEKDPTILAVLNAEKKRRTEEKKKKRTLNTDNTVLDGNELVNSISTGEVEVASNDDLNEYKDPEINHTNSDKDLVAETGHAIAWKTTTGLDAVEMAEQIEDADKSNAIALSEFLEDPSIDKTKFKLEFFIDRTRLSNAQNFAEGVEEGLKALHKKIIAGEDISDEDIGVLPVRAYIVNEKGERYRKNGKAVTAAAHDTTFAGWEKLSEDLRKKAQEETIAFKRKVLAAEMAGNKQDVTADITEVRNGHIMNQKDARNNISVVTGIDPSKVTLVMGDAAAKGKSSRYVSKPKDKIEEHEDLEGYTSATPGAVYAVVKTANGSSFPLRTFVGNLSEVEANLIYELYRKTFENGKAYKESLSKHPDIKKLIKNSKDPRVSGLGKFLNLDKITIGDLIKTLVYEGTQTKKVKGSPGTLVAGKESIRIGNTSFNKQDFLEDPEAKQEFIDKVRQKSRQVNIGLLNKPNYVAYLIENEILTTTATSFNGVMFRQPTTVFGKVEISGATEKEKTETEPTTKKTGATTSKTKKFEDYTAEEIEEIEEKETARFKKDKKTKKISLDDFIKRLEKLPNKEAEIATLKFIKEFWNGNILYNENFDFKVPNPNVSGNQTWGGTFDFDSNSVFIFNERAFNEEFVIHEALHGLVQTKLEKFQDTATEFDAEFSQEIHRLFEHAKTQLNANDWYGLTDVHEFVSEAFGDPNFRNELAKMADPSPKVLEEDSNIFKSFIQAIKDFFANNNKDIEASVLESIIKATNKTLSGQEISNETSASPSFGISVLEIAEELSEKYGLKVPGLGFDTTNPLDALKGVADNTTNKHYKNLAEVFLKIKGIEKINFVIDSALEVPGRYMPSRKEVIINVNKIVERSKAKGYNVEEMLEQTILHEFVHALTKEETLKIGKLTKKTNEFINNINELFKEARKNEGIKNQNFIFYLNIYEKHRRNPKSITEKELEFLRDNTFKYYGLTSIDEFLTMSMTNPEFRAKLKTQNLWEKFKRSVAKFLGVAKNDLDYLEMNFDKFLESKFGTGETTEQKPGTRKDFKVGDKFNWNFDGTIEVTVSKVHNDSVETEWVNENGEEKSKKQGKIGLLNTLNNPKDYIFTELGQPTSQEASKDTTTTTDTATEVKVGDVVTPEMVVIDETTTFGDDTLADRIQEGIDAGKSAFVVSINGVSEKGTSVELRVVSKTGAQTFSVFLKPTQQATTDTTTKVNPGKQVIDKIKAAIKKSGIKVKKDKNGEETDFYIDKEKNEWSRTTSFANPMDEEAKNSPIVKSSTLVGTKIDELIRDFFEEGSTLSSKSDPTILYNYRIGKDGKIENVEKFLIQLEKIKEHFKKTGETVVSSGIILQDDVFRLAGTVDLITYDREGKIRIYDVKTMRGNQLAEAYSNDPNNVKYDSTYYGKSYRQKHTDQLSIYAAMLENTYGVTAVELGVLPVEVMYENDGKVHDTTSELKLNDYRYGKKASYPFIKIDYDSNVITRIASEKLAAENEAAREKEEAVGEQENEDLAAEFAEIEIEEIETKDGANNSYEDTDMTDPNNIETEREVEEKEDISQIGDPAHMSYAELKALQKRIAEQKAAGKKTKPLLKKARVAANISSNLKAAEPGITEEKIKQIYDDYVRLMRRQRPGSEMEFKWFEQVVDNMQVFKFKDTYVFGQYDVNTGTFVVRVQSSPSIKQLFGEAIPAMGNFGVDVLAFVPKDMATAFGKLGYVVSDKGYAYNFHGEDMHKYAVASDSSVLRKVFGKNEKELTEKEIRKYDRGVFAAGIENQKNFQLAPVEIDANAVKAADGNLTATLETYLNSFGVAVKDISEMQKSLNIDSVGVADILSKIAYIKNLDALPEVAGEFIAHMMQYNPLVKEILKQRKYKKIKNKEDQLKAVGKLIGESLRNPRENIAKDDNSLLGKIKRLIAEFLSILGKTDVARINRNINAIVSNTLQQNRKLITSSEFKPGEYGKPVSQVSVDKALEKDKFGASIIDRLSKSGFMLTGSTALSEQGTILRPEENPLHDIDWVSPFSREETLDKLFAAYPGAIKVRDIIDEKYTTDSYLIVPEGYKAANVVLENFVAEDGSDRIVLQSYDVIDAKTNEVKGTYRLEDRERIDPITGNVLFTKGGLFKKSVPKTEKVEVSTDVEGKVIDFFTYPSYETSIDAQFGSTSTVAKTGETIQLANWKSIFAAKLDFARYKDIWDYNRFVPVNNQVSFRDATGGIENKKVLTKINKKPKPTKPNTGNITQAEIDEVANMVPNDIAVSVLEDYITLLDGGIAVVGAFQEGLIALSRKGRKGDGYHEAFHAVFRTMLGKEQQQELLQEARDMFMPLESDVVRLMARHKLTAEKATDLWYEEQLADEFAVYGANPRAYDFNKKKGRQSYFERLFSWSKDIAGVTGNMERMFKDLKQGNFRKENNVDLLIQSGVVKSINDKTGKPC